MRNNNWLAYAVAVLLALSACAVAPSGTPTPSPSPTRAMTALTATATLQQTATPLPSITPLESTPTVAPIDTPTATMELPIPYPAAVRAAIEKLSRESGISATDISLKAIQRVEWPDACLGMKTPGVMCAMIVTPGYRIILTARGRQYEYHTNLDGSSIVYSAGGSQSNDKPVLLWRQSGDSCINGLLSTRRVAVTPCAGAMLNSTLTDTDTQMLGHFTSVFASFSATTKIGNIILVGTGSQVATAAEQRSMAEFARYVTLRVSSTQAVTDMALEWHREGGIAGFCDDVAVSVSGQLRVSSCRSSSSQSLGVQWLDPRQLQAVYDWIDEYQPYQTSHAGAVNPDELVVTVKFYGRGNIAPTESTKQSIAAFAQQLRTTFKPS